jgi:hypothetical protein
VLSVPRSAHCIDQTIRENDKKKNVKRSEPIEQSRFSPFDDHGHTALQATYVERANNPIPWTGAQVVARHDALRKSLRVLNDLAQQFNVPAIVAALSGLLVGHEPQTI